MSKRGRITTPKFYHIFWLYSYYFRFWRAAKWRRVIVVFNNFFMLNKWEVLFWFLGFLRLFSKLLIFQGRTKPEVIKIIKELLFDNLEKWMSKSLLNGDSFYRRRLNAFSYQIHCYMWRISYVITDWLLRKFAQRFFNRGHSRPVFFCRRSTDLEYLFQLIHTTRSMKQRSQTEQFSKDASKCENINFRPIRWNL